MQDIGVEIVQTWGFWVILRRLASEGGFELYTDVDSSIEHYRKIRKMFKVAAVIELLCFFMEAFGALNGNVYAFAFMFLLGAFLIALVNIVFKTNEIIEELQERKGECTHKKFGRRISPLVPCGMLVSSCALLSQEAVFPAVTTGLQIAAIVMMLVGLYCTVQIRDK